jgi:hypothetical protein
MHIFSYVPNLVEEVIAGNKIISPIRPIGDKINSNQGHILVTLFKA